MEDFEDTQVLERPQVSNEPPGLDTAIREAVSTGELNLTHVEGADAIDWDDIRSEIADFATQCRILSHLGLDHPCVRLGEVFVPVEILETLGQCGGTLDESADRELVRQATESCLLRARASDLVADLLPIDEAKSTFRTELKKFIRRRIQIFFGGGLPTDSGEGFRGLKVTVTAGSEGLAVVHCTSFFFRREIVFGESLTSPVVGYIRNAGSYYFGTLDRTMDGARWSTAEYEIPPNLAIALPF